MAGKKKRSCYRKTRKGKGFGGCERESKKCEKTTENLIEINHNEPCTSGGLSMGDS
jgi:hypothetical protein